MSNTNTDPEGHDLSPASQRQSGWRPTGRASSRRSFLARLVRDEGGDSMIMFGLMFPLLMLMVGVAVDYGRWLNARNQTQNALDSAVLAAGRTLQTTYGDATTALASANAYYKQMKSPIAVNDTITFVATKSNTTIEAKGNAYIKTPFLSVIHITELPLLVVAESKHAEATIAQGGNSGSSVEVGLMLDTTGSMSGQKLTDLKLAAKDLVDIVVWDDQSKFTSRIAIAPFANTVNVGDYFQNVTGQNPNLVTHNETTTKQTGTTTTYVYPSSCYNSNGTLKSSCKNKSQYAVVTPVYTTTTITVVDNVAKAKCVVERNGSEEFKGTVPGPGAWITTWNDATASNFTNRTALLSAGATNGGDFDAASDATKTTCPEASTIVPLTSNKTLLKSTIDGLVANYSTAGALGTAWAWYLIEPDWGTIFTGSSKPEPYSKTTQLGTSGQPLLQKIAILMTDGAYNTHQGVQYSDSSAKAISIQTKAKSVCTAMKAKGIKVYTVGFQLGNDANAISTLSNCATDATYFYNAANGEALRVAFRDIALKISNLRLSY
jgi:Flp pilus assembly protein TadG